MKKLFVNAVSYFDKAQNNISGKIDAASKRAVHKMVILLVVASLLLSCLTGCFGNQSSFGESESDTQTDVTPITSSVDNSEIDTESLKALAVTYAGKTIGVQLGTVFDAIINQYIPDATVEYFNSNADMALALKSSKISAYIADEPMARLLCQTYTDQYITGVFEKCPYAFIYPKGTEKTQVIRTQMNQFLAKIKADGTLKEIDSLWFGDDESLKVVDTSDLTGENGILEFSIATVVGAPFVYVKDNSYVGYDVDIAVRFCREYGYGIHINDTNASGLFASISSGLTDFGASSICITEERKEEMDFSNPDYEGSVVLVTKKRDEADISEVSDASKFSVLNGKNIGIITGSPNNEYLEKHIPNCNLVERTTTGELAAALEAGIVDAYLDDQPFVKEMLTMYPTHHVLGVAEKSYYACIFKQDSQRSDKLRTQMNKFIANIQSERISDEIESIWFGNDETKKIIEYNSLTGENGTITFAVATSTGAPFMYSIDNTMYGFEADFAYRFCEAYGYDLKFVDTKHSDIFTKVENGECDIGMSCITINEERSKLYDFSDPYYSGGSVIVTKLVDEFDVSKISDPDVIAELNGKKIGYLADSIFKDTAEKSIDYPELIPFSSNADLGKALESESIDAYITDQPIARISVKAYKDHFVQSVLASDKYAYVFQKDNTEYPILQEQMNSFLKNLRVNGTLDKIDDIWFGENITLQTVDFSNLTGENGTIKMGINSGIGAPFCYISEDKYIGFEIDIAVRFCYEYGYNLNLVDCNSPQKVIDGICEGKYDIGASSLSITEERKQIVNFSEPYYYGGIIVIAKGEQDTSESSPSFFTTMANSFRKTFVRENRYKMFVSGFGVTLLLTLLSALFGSQLGFLLYLIYRKGNRIVNLIVDWLSEFLQMTPVVVILMIFYYLVFGKAGYSGIAVSIIAFSLMFACSVKNLFVTAVGAVDPGQALAVRALGYRDTKGFIRMILPQTIPHFVPGFKGEIVGLIKNTSIVSYVAVQDLTMVTDIIRARTYDAFFPLIITAAIYFAMAQLLTKLIGRIEIKINPCNRKESSILKGVKK